MGRSFIHENFLLGSDAAERLFHEYAADCPIHDYHSHLDPIRLRDNQPFRDLTEIWLEGDHYKWRAMRAAGIDEALITGNAAPEEKFLAWASVVPKTL
ncbi:MAG: glucuronate isomerase, partial [Pseudomonadales bacterium]|nr:glucuronate isomerase [Pseudomonadales bacterium]